MKNSSLFILGFVVLTLRPVQPVYAEIQQARLSDCTQDPGCFVLKERAAERSKAGDIVEALRLYRLAYELAPDSRLFFNIARLLHKQGQNGEAATYYQKFLDSPIQDEEQRQRAREYLGQIQPGANPTSARLPSGTPESNTLHRPALSTQSDAASAQKPIYTRWWFWTIIGSVVAVGVAGGVAGGVIASQRLPEPIVRPFEP